MDTALLVLCLDGAAPPAGEAVARAVLVGSGSQRWFDKLCAIVFSDGASPHPPGVDRASAVLPLTHSPPLSRRHRRNQL